MSYRAGLHGTVNAVLGAVFFLAFAAVAVLGAGAALSGESPVWGWVGALVAVGAMAFSGLAVAGGAGSWRPVRLDDGPGGTLSLPGFDVRRGWYRSVVPLGQVAAVEMRYLSQPRNGRWQLAVVRRDGTVATSDSVTCSRGSTADVSASAGGRVAAELQARLARWQATSGRGTR